MIKDITTQNFEADVLEASKETPLVLFFNSSQFAECAPLLQTLEKLSQELHFSLCVVDLDKEENSPFIQYFRIASLPDTRVIHKGEIIDVLQGNCEESALKERLEKHFVSDAEKVKLNIQNALAKGDIELTHSLLNDALQNDPKNNELKILQARFFLKTGDTEKAKNILDAFTESDAVYNEALSLKNMLDFFAEVAKTDSVSGEALLYRNACRYAIENETEKALNTFLEILKTNKEWNDSAASKAMLTMFGVLGKKHALTWEYRAKMNTILFI